MSWHFFLLWIFVCHCFTRQPQSLRTWKLTSTKECLHLWKITWNLKIIQLNREIIWTKPAFLGSMLIFQGVYRISSEESFCYPRWRLVTLGFPKWLTRARDSKFLCWKIPAWITRSRWWQLKLLFGKFHPANWGRFPIWRAYFPKGLKPPTRLDE